MSDDEMIKMKNLIYFDAMIPKHIKPRKKSVVFQVPRLTVQFWHRLGTFFFLIMCRVLCAFCLINHY